jgi:hypothetical protein
MIFLKALTSALSSASAPTSLAVSMKRSWQLGFRQDRLRLRHHARGRMLAAGNVIVEQRLHLCHALADFPNWVVDHQYPLKLLSLQVALPLGCK